MKKKIFAITMATVLALSLALVLAGPTSADPGSGIVGWWQFEEGSGTTTSDASGNENNGTLKPTTSEPTWTMDSAFGTYALNFDGVNDYVEIANESNFDFNKDDPFSLKVSVRTSSDATTLRIITKMQNSDPKRGWSLNTYDDGSGPLLYFVLRNSAANKIRVHGSSDITDGLWHDIVVTYCGSADASGVQIYVDGSPETMTITDDNLTLSTLNDVKVQISGRDGSNHVFDGKIDEVRIWDTCLYSVPVDIKPGSFPNSINLGSKGVVPVAILSSGDFDAATVDPQSVELEGAAARLKGKSGNAGSLEDVNGDGLLDLVVQVTTEDLGLALGDAEAVLTGETYGGVPIQGTDSVRIVPPE